MDKSDCFQEFTKTFEGCDITINNPDKNGDIEVRYNFGEAQNFLHLANRVTEHQRIGITPAKMEEELYRRAITDLERSLR